MNEWRNFPTRAGDMFSGRLTLPEHGYPLRGSERNTDARHSLSRDFPETFPPGHIRSSVSPFGTDDPASIDWSQKLADPASLMSGAQIDEQIVNRFDGNPPRDRMGRPLSGEQADSVVARWPEKVREMSPDARDIAFALNYRHDPVFRTRTNRTIFRNWLAMPEQENRESLSRRKPEAPVLAPREMHVPPVPEKNREKNGNGLDITSRVHRKNEVAGPADESMMPGYRMYGNLLEKHIGKPSAVNGQGEQPVTHPDESMEAGYRIAGQAIENGLGHPSAVNARGTQPVAHPDESMGPLMEKGFGSMRHQTVADAIRENAEAAGTVMNREHGSEFARHFGKGAGFSPREIRKNLYALAAFIGDATDFALPGDNTGLEKTKNDLIAMKREEEEQGFLRGSNVFERGWESIAENGSLWIAEQMGRKLVQLPLAVAMSLVPSLGALTGMAVLDVCSDLYGEILYRTGKGEPLETLTFGVPLGLMQLLVPTRIPVRQVTRPKEVAQRLWRMVLQGMVHGVQKEQMDHVLKRKKKQKPTDKEASGEN